MPTTTLVQNRCRHTRSWLVIVFLLLTSPAAFAQLNGAYTINSAQPTAGTNYASFTAAAVALTGVGVSGPVTFTVTGGPYNEQISLPQLVGSSATNRVTFNGGGRTIQFGSNTAAQRAVITLSGADYVTVNNLVVDATVGGTSTATYGWGIQLLNNSDNNIISNCTIMADKSSTNSSNFAGIISNASSTNPTTTGITVSQNLTISGNIISGGYYGIAVLGSGVLTAPTAGVVVINNSVLDFHSYAIYISYLGGARIQGNNIARPTRTVFDNYFGIYVGPGTSGSAVEKNRIHQPFPAGSTTSSGAYGIYLASFTAAGTSNPNDFVNNLLYDLNGNGPIYGIFTGSSNNSRVYFNTITLDDQTNTSTSNTVGLYQTTGVNVDFRNNIVRVTRSGAGTNYAILMSSPITTFISNNNDLVGSGTNYVTGSYAGTVYPALANWRTANGGAYDQSSLQVDPQFVGLATGNLQPSVSALRGAAAPLARVTDDFTGAIRSTTPDIGAYELSAPVNDVAVVSIDSPTTPAMLGINPVKVTVRNGGSAVLTSATLSYSLNGAAPVTQLFSGLNIAYNATQQLTFTTGASATSGNNTLTVTGSLPNGQPDENAANNTQTIIFTLSVPSNDEPCSALGLGTAAVSSSNLGATTSIQPGIVTPACSPASLPKDVWFTFTPSGTSTTLTLTGAPAGMVRVFTSPSCSTGPFTQIFCQGSGANNTSVGAVMVPGLTVGTRYYVAVSGYGSADTGGNFTISATAVLATRTSSSAELAVFPNPSSNGQLTLRLTRPISSGSVRLLNALGQSVRQQALTSAEEQLSTRGLAAGFYTLLVQAGSDVLTRKVVLE